jgi:hypothetical protein
MLNPVPIYAYQSMLTNLCSFISLVRYLRAQARNVRMNWLRGDYSEPFPVGLFPPCQPILANLLPAFVRNSLAPL